MTGERSPIRRASDFAALSAAEDVGTKLGEGLSHLAHGLGPHPRLERGQQSSRLESPKRCERQVAEGRARLVATGHPDSGHTRAGGLVGNGAPQCDDEDAAPPRRIASRNAASVSAVFPE